MVKIKKNAKIYLGLFLIVTMFGCASVPRTNVNLERARTAYAQANANPDVVANAQVPMYDAKQALDRAEAAKELEEIEYLSYLAERKAQTAVVMAERKMAEGEVERLSKERDRILLERRGMETDQARMKVSTLEAELAELRAKQVPAKETDRGIVLTLGDVLFAYNKANVKPRGRRIIDNVSEFLQKYTERTVTIEGHTDSIGSEEYNLGLSQRRADAVRYVLVANGIDSTRIQTRGMGEAYPVASNDTDAGRQQNRRVEIIISKSAEAVQ